MIQPFILFSMSIEWVSIEDFVFTLVTAFDNYIYFHDNTNYHVYVHGVYMVLKSYLPKKKLNMHIKGTVLCKTTYIQKRIYHFKGHFSNIKKYIFLCIVDALRFNYIC